MPRVPVLYDFRWPVPIEGYRWQELPDDAGGLEPALLPAGPAAKDYYPMREHPGLFLMLAELAPTPDAVRGFANQYGALEHFDPTERRSAGPPPPQPMTRAAPPPGLLDEPTPTFEGFSAEIRETLAKDGASKLSVSWFKDWEREISHLRHEVGSMFGWSLYARFLKADDRAAINEHIQRRLQGHIAPLLTGESVECVPTTLLGAVWLQLALAIAHNKHYRRCEGPSCPRVWFEVSKAPFGLRPEARYCSPTCRNRAWLARKASQ